MTQIQRTLSVEAFRTTQGVVAYVKRLLPFETQFNPRLDMRQFNRARDELRALYPSFVYILTNDSAGYRVSVPAGGPLWYMNAEWVLADSEEMLMVLTLFLSPGRDAP